MSPFFKILFCFVIFQEHDQEGEKFPPTPSIFYGAFNPFEPVTTCHKLESAPPV